MISRVKSMQLGVYVHPHAYIRIGWWYHQSTKWAVHVRASPLFSMSFLIAGWLLMIGGAAGRWVDPLTLPGLCNCYRRWWTASSGISDRRLDVSPSVVGRLWRSYQETGEYTRNRVKVVPWWQPQNKTVFLLLFSPQSHKYGLRPGNCLPPEFWSSFARPDC